MEILIILLLLITMEYSLLPYSIIDSVGATSCTVSVSVTVAAVNDPPSPTNDAFTINEDATAAALKLISNDNDVEGSTLTLDAILTNCTLLWFILLFHGCHR